MKASWLDRHIGLVFFVALFLFLLALTVCPAYSQPLGPHGELIADCFIQAGGCEHGSLFPSSECEYAPRPCPASTAWDGDGPVVCYDGADPVEYARWAWGAAAPCQGCVPFDVRAIVASTVPLTYPAQADFEKAAPLLAVTTSWQLNPGLSCIAWRQQLRAYYCSITVHDRTRCVADGYTQAPGGPTWTPLPSSALTRTAIAPSFTSTFPPTTLRTSTAPASPSRTVTATPLPASISAGASPTSSPAPGAAPAGSGCGGTHGVGVGTLLAMTVVAGARRRG